MFLGKTEGQPDCTYIFNQREREVVEELDADYRRIYQREPDSPDLVVFSGR